MKTTNTASARITFVFMLLITFFATAKAGDETNEVKAVGHTLYQGQNKESNLTDEEKRISEEYVHQGLNKRKLDELCKGEKKAACDGEPASVFKSGSMDQMVSSLSKAYALIVGMTDSKIKMGVKGDVKTKDAKEQINKKTTEGVSDKSKTKEVNDYCKYIAMATETVGTFKQQADHQNITNTPLQENTAQKEVLYSAARTHKSRSDTAKIQTIGWGSTAGCYAGHMAYSGMQGGKDAFVETGKSVALKLAATTLLAVYFGKLTGKHKSYEEIVKEIADSMPGKGECNPVTETNCYCSQPETEHDPQYCKKNREDSYIAKRAVLDSCVNNKLEDDPDCTCAKTDTCFSKKYRQILEGIGLGKDFAKTNYASIKSITDGSLTGAEANASYAANLNAARKLMKKHDNKFPVKGHLSASERKETNALKDFGLSSNFAKMIAKSPTTSQSKRMADMLKSSGNFRQEDLSRMAKKGAREQFAKVLRFSGGSGLKKSPYKRRKSSKDFDLSAFMKQRDKKGPSAKVLKFMNEAKNKAQISSKKDYSIFKNVTNRYQRSGWPRLSVVE